MRHAKLALVQFESSILDVEANSQKGLEFVRQAWKQNADLVVFPELFITGYHLDVIQHRFYELAETLDGPTLKNFRQAAKQYSINLVVPMVLKDSAGSIFNSAAVIDRNGDIQGAHHKVHLWKEEKKYFTPGHQFSVFDLDFGRIGIMICFDAGFPETARMLALRGAELLVSPAAFAHPDKYRWDIYFPARALENGCFVAGVNRTGQEEQDIYFGNNKVVNPWGEIMTETKSENEEMQIVEIDLDQVKECREEIPYLQELRTETYQYGSRAKVNEKIQT